MSVIHLAYSWTTAASAKISSIFNKQLCSRSFALNTYKIRGCVIKYAILSVGIYEGTKQNVSHSFIYLYILLGAIINEQFAKSVRVCFPQPCLTGIDFLFLNYLVSSLHNAKLQKICSFYMNLIIIFLLNSISLILSRNLAGETTHIPSPYDKISCSSSKFGRTSISIS